MKCPIRVERQISRKSSGKEMQSKIQTHEGTELRKLGKRSKKEKCQQTCKKVFGCLLTNQNKQTRTARFTTLPSLTKGKALTSLP